MFVCSGSCLVYGWLWVMCVGVVKLIYEVCGFVVYVEVLQCMVFLLLIFEVVVLMFGNVMVQYFEDNDIGGLIVEVQVVLCQGVEYKGFF